MPLSMKDLSSPTRAQTYTTALGAWSLRHQTTREVGGPTIAYRFWLLAWGCCALTISGSWGAGGGFTEQSRQDDTPGWL